MNNKRKPQSKAEIRERLQEGLQFAALIHSALERKQKDGERSGA